MSETQPGINLILNYVLHRGVWVIFLFSAALMLITLVHFLLGIITERAVCEPLQSPENNQLLMLVDKVIRLDKFFDSEAEITVSSIIRFVSVFFLFWSKIEIVLCVISGFCVSVNEIFALPGCYTA